MSEDEAQSASNSVTELIYGACRQAATDEITVAWQALLQPILMSFDRRLAEIEKGMIQIEKSVCELMPDDPNEPWRESLD